MSDQVVQSGAVTLRQAFEAEQARREAERRAREEAERRQQEEDLARAEQLQAMLGQDAAFLADKGLTLERRRYTVTLEHAEFRVSAYFEAGKAMVRLADKLEGGAIALRKEQLVESLDDAVLLMAQYLADERV